MSAEPTLFINGQYAGPILAADWRAYVERHYPGCPYELVDGYKVKLTVSKQREREMLAKKRKVVEIGD